MAIPEKGSEPNRAEQHHHMGHSFGMDVHPERYPRESLSRLEEGILDDDQLRHAHDRLGYVGPDLESRVDDARNLSRTRARCTDHFAPLDHHARHDRHTWYPAGPAYRRRARPCCSSA